ncbi:ABC transporter substrate-binding protein, partial [Rhizobium johnstonii]|uniref:ABC transporter substrate-binding protein n=1 Tax=Rhizobium johnstonii TaxID=3019933 RepID=UPI003F9B646A
MASAGTRFFAQSEGPLRIGVLFDFSSVASTSGGKGSVAAVELAVEDFGGQALGRQIEIVFRRLRRLQLKKVKVTDAHSIFAHGKIITHH